MYSSRKIPEPFNGRPSKKAVPPSEKSIKPEEPAPSLKATEEKNPSKRQTHNHASPLLTLFFLDYFSHEKKDG